MKSIAVPLMPEMTILGEEDTQHARLEADLLSRAARGEGRAFEALIRPHLPMLFRVAGRLAGSASLAEDAVQDTLEYAYRHLHRYRAGTSFRAWLATIAVKKAAGTARSERRRARRHEKIDPLPPSIAGDDKLIRAEHIARIRAILERMPATRRQAALMRLDAGLSYAEIAQALDTTAGSARVLVHLALKEIKKEMAGSGA